jgi:hypothetical protein
MIAYRHAFSTSATDEKPLQERWSFPWWGESLRSIGLTIHGKLSLISLIVFPCNISHMGIVNKRNPFSTGLVGNVDFSIGRLGQACSPIGIRSRIGWLVQNSQHIVVLDFSPHDFPLMWPAPYPPRKEQVFLVKVANRREGRSGVLKKAKDLANGSLHLEIGIKDNHVTVGVTKTDGYGKVEGSTPCFVENPSLETST